MPRDTPIDSPRPAKLRPSAAPGRPDAGPSPPRQAQDRRGSGRTDQPKRRYVRFTRWRRRRFFALLEESGNVRMACALSGAGLGCIYRLRRTEPGFVALMAAAKAKADGVLRDASPAPEDERLADDCVVIRHGRGGRLRMMAPGDHWWSSRHDAIFLGHLRVTGNATLSAKAAGFTVKSAWNRRERLPSFARAWDKALEESEERLQGRLTREVLTGTLGMDRHGTAQEQAAAAAERGPFDVWLAFWLLKHWEAQRQGKKPRRGAGGAARAG